ncbi:hypothetical protein IW262DRAFT_1496445, partial [Armillaria fumosa]
CRTHAFPALSSFPSSSPLIASLPLHSPVWWSIHRISVYSLCILLQWWLSKVHCGILFFIALSLSFSAVIE